MKATGIVRRIDDLGRVVIPKEIRRTMRIREGDPLEIYTDNDGEVIFKKYSPIGELSGFAGIYAEVLHKTGGSPVVVCDRDHVVAVSGIPKKELLERRVSPSLEEMMEARQTFTLTASNAGRLQPVEGSDRLALAAAPILSAGDVCGAVMFLKEDSTAAASEADVRSSSVPLLLFLDVRWKNNLSNPQAERRWKSHRLSAFLLSHIKKPIQYMPKCSRGISLLRKVNPQKSSQRKTREFVPFHILPWFSFYL